jgi:hypothetical protein
VFEPITELCPTQLCEEIITVGSLERIDFLLSDLSVVYLHILLPSDLTTGLPAIMHDWKDFKRKVRRSDRLWQFSQFIDSIDSARKPTMYFLDICLPHRLWEYLPSGKKYRMFSKTNIWDFLPHGKKSTDFKIMGTGIGSKGEIWGDDGWIVTQGYQLHLLQVGLVDKLLGQLMDKLKAVDLYNRSLIVVTADHGISFRPNDYLRVVVKSNSGDIMFVPLFIKAPNQHEGVIDDRNIKTIDILPTIMDILGIQLPWELDGRSAFDKSLPERTQALFFNPRKEELRFTIGTLLYVKHDTLKWKSTLFGSGTPDGLFRIGPHNSLVGLPMRAIDIVEGDFTVELDQELFYANVDPEAPFVNSHITGLVFLDGHTGAKVNLAISVNGTIRAVTRTFPLERGEAEWSAMVPETAFRGGKNHVEVFILSTDTDGQLYLMRPESPSHFIYTLSSLRKTLTRHPDGTSIQIVPKALQGFVRSVDRGGLR